VRNLKAGDHVFVQWGLDEVEGVFRSHAGLPGRRQAVVDVAPDGAQRTVTVPLAAVRIAAAATQGAPTTIADPPAASPASGGPSRIVARRLHLREPPAAWVGWATIIGVPLAVVAIVIAVVAYAVPRDHAASGSAGGQPGPTTSSPAATSSPSTSASAPALAPNDSASCESLRHVRTTQDSPLALAGGPLLEAKILSGHDATSRYARLLHIKAGDVVLCSLMLHDPDYADTPDVVVSVPLPRGVADCWKIVARARSTSVAQVDVTTSLVGAKGEKLAFDAVPGSTHLYSEDGMMIADLPDGISTGEVPVPVAIPAGKAMFVNFQATLK
jgi:hypothetical protein